MPGHSEALATAAHLHVLLRRKTGRVTDTEWMASNPEYARAIIQFTRDKALSEDMTDLLPWADKLETLLPSMGTQPRKPLLEAAVEHLKTTARHRPNAERHAPELRVSGFRESDFNPASATGADQRYVGGIR